MRRGRGRFSAALTAAALLAGCATLPAGPTVRVMPGPYKPFEVFQADDAACRQWASQQSGRSPQAAADDSLARGGLLGALLGAGLGALIGSTSANAGAGAAIGGGAGLLGGLAVAGEPAYAAGWEVQRRYDIAYEQCMYAKGNQVSGAWRSYSPPASPHPVPPPPPPPRRP